MARVERYGPGEAAAEYEPGDFILTHRSRPIAALISLGQKRRFRGPDSVYAHWTHMALIVERDGTIVEAEALGVVRSPVSKYLAPEFHLVRLGAELAGHGRIQPLGVQQCGQPDGERGERGDRFRSRPPGEVTGLTQCVGPVSGELGDGRYSARSVTPDLLHC